MNVDNIITDNSEISRNNLGIQQIFFQMWYIQWNIIQS